MEFLNYKSINAKLRKRGIIFKKPSLEETSSQFYTLARQLDDHKLYSGLCHLAITNCQTRENQLGAFLNAARAFSRASSEVISQKDHIKVVVWIYSKALVICDRSFIRPICLEMGRFYEVHKMHHQAAECFKQSMSISRCVYNLMLAKNYRSALNELKNCPSHLMTIKDHTSMFLLELLLNDDLEDNNRNSLQNLSANSQVSTNRGLLPTDDYLFDLIGLLESLSILQQDYPKKRSQKERKIMNTIVNRLSAFLDPAQIQLLYLITNN